MPESFYDLMRDALRRYREGDSEQLVKLLHQSGMDVFSFLHVAAKIQVRKR